MVVICSVTELGDLLEFKVVITSLSTSNLDVDDVTFVDVGGAKVGVSIGISPVLAKSRSISLVIASFINGVLENFIGGIVVVITFCISEVSSLALGIPLC